MSRSFNFVVILVVSFHFLLNLTFPFVSNPKTNVYGEDGTNGTLPILRHGMLLIRPEPESLSSSVKRSVGPSTLTKRRNIELQKNDDEVAAVHLTSDFLSNIS